MERAVDVVVVGSGAAGQTVAAACAEAGKRVVVVDDRPFGGTCALRGCEPKKVFVSAAAAVDAARRLEGKGVRTAGLAIDWPALAAFKRTFTDPVPESVRASFEKAGIEAVRGRARFTDERTIAVGEDSYRASHVALAAGARPRPLGIPGEDLVATSDDFLDLERLPERIAFIGGGYISMEFAHVAARAGARVTVLHRGERILEPFDADLVADLQEATRAAGIDLRTQASVEAVERSGKTRVVRGKGPEGAFCVEADLVVHGAGRVPNVDGLDLERGNVARDRKGVRVNAHLQSVTNPRVYAAGDASAAGNPPLTPVASREGEVVAENILHGNRREIDLRAVPSVVFTLPPLAMVGLTEEAARERGIDVEVKGASTASWASSRRLGEAHSRFKTLVEKETGRLVGAHLLGPHADEAVNVLALAMAADVDAERVKRVLYGYPTSGSDLKYMF